jgi:cytoskeleton protein RodZ
MNSEWAEQPRSGDEQDTPGMQLKAGREAMGWSIEQVADQIKLAPRQVLALEAGDADALPNLAVVRGFIRAYAKVLKLDAAPLVAMIEVDPVPGAQAAPARREISASFSEARFPSLTQRSSKRNGWLGGAVLLVAVAVAAFGAYQMGLIPPALLSRSDKSATEVAVPAAAPVNAAPLAAPLETTLIKPEQMPPVPLISIPGPAPGTPGAPAVLAETAPVPAPAPAPAAVTGNALVLNVREDSWVEIRRNGAAPMISRMVTAGNAVNFEITEPVQLIVGRPGGVDATLRGEALQLTSAAGTTTARLNIK